jgi:hypothetical protein
VPRVRRAVARTVRLAIVPVDKVRKRRRPPRGLHAGCTAPTSLGCA